MTSTPPPFSTETPIVHEIDEVGCAIYLYCPSNKVVLLQGYFETYEGLGIVRTISTSDSLICIITTKNMVESCLNFLMEIREEIPWQLANQISDSSLCLEHNKKEN